MRASFVVGSLVLMGCVGKMPPSSPGAVLDASFRDLESDQGTRPEMTLSFQWAESLPAEESRGVAVRLASAVSLVTPEGRAVALETEVGETVINGNSVSFVLARPLTDLSGGWHALVVDDSGLPELDFGGWPADVQGVRRRRFNPHSDPTIVRARVELDVSSAPEVLTVLFSEPVGLGGSIFSEVFAVHDSEGNRIPCREALGSGETLASGALRSTWSVSCDRYPVEFMIDGTPDIASSTGLAVHEFESLQPGFSVDLAIDDTQPAFGAIWRQN